MKLSRNFFFLISEVWDLSEKWKGDLNLKIKSLRPEILTLITESMPFSTMLKLLISC